jgi:hypothetical protein
MAPLRGRSLFQISGAYTNVKFLFLLTLHFIHFCVVFMPWNFTFVQAQLL